MKPLLVAPEAAFMGAEKEHRWMVANMPAEFSQADIPDDSLTMAETNSLVMGANIEPVRTKVRVQLDNVPGFGNAQGATRVKIISRHTFSRAVHDVMINDALVSRKIGFLNNSRHIDLPTVAK